jgi:hypothetical protein
MSSHSKLANCKRGGLKLLNKLHELATSFDVSRFISYPSHFKIIGNAKSNAELS